MIELVKQGKQKKCWFPIFTKRRINSGMSIAELNNHFGEKKSWSLATSNADGNF